MCLCQNLFYAMLALSLKFSLSQCVCVLAKKRIQDRLGGYADPQTGESRVKKSKRQVSIEVQPESDEESTATSSRKASPETVRRPVLRRENSKANGNTAELVVKKLSSSKRNIWSHRATDSTSLEDEKPTNRSAKLRVGRGDQLEKEDGRKHARPLYSSSNHTKPGGLFYPQKQLMFLQIYGCASLHLSVFVHEIEYCLINVPFIQ